MTHISLFLAVCPDCPGARAARALVLADGFWLHAGHALLPFLVVALIVRLFTRHLEKGDRRASS